jgi:hypothetical protein
MHSASSEHRTKRFFVVINTTAQRRVTHFDGEVNLEKIRFQEIRCIYIFSTYILTRNHNIDRLCANFFTLCMYHTYRFRKHDEKGAWLQTVMKIRWSYIRELLLERACVTQLIRMKCTLYHSLRPRNSQHPSD